MKFLLIMALLWASCLTALAQQTTPPGSATQPADTTQRPPNKATPPPAATADDIAKLIPQISPKSPNMAAFNRYGEHPVNMFTGVPSIEIPLYTIQAGAISVPITLNYHAGGHKVTDAASWVGLGWTLQPGGAVTRQQRGMADEATSVGILGKAVITDPYASYTLSPSCYNTTIRSYYNQVINNQLDNDRDLFSVRTPRTNNQFIMRDSDDVQLLSEDRSQINYRRVGNVFTLAEADGTISRFDQPEIALGGYPNAWLMGSMQGLQPADRVQFSYYAPANYSRLHDVVESVTLNDNKVGSAGSSFPVTRENLVLITIENAVNERLLQTIHFPGGKVEFVLQAASRQDLSGKALDRIQVYGFKPATNTYELIKSYQFMYDYYVRAGSNGLEKMLMLNAVRMLDATGTSIGQYSFNYNTAKALPNVQSKARDYWGYFNGQTGNTTLIPTQSIALTLPNQVENIGGGNHLADETSMKAWILTQITYPTGGYTTFDFEANQYLEGNTPTKAGGLRIQQMTRYAGSSAVPVLTTYRYGAARDGNGRLRNPVRLGYETQQDAVIYSGGDSNIPHPSFTYRIRRYTSSFSTALFPQEGSPVTYVNVTEYADDGTGSNGRTDYTFRDSDDVTNTLNRSAKYYTNSRHWNRGQLVSKIVYGADGRKKTAIQNTYQIFGPGSTTDAIGQLIQAQTIVGGDGRQTDNSGSCYVTNTNEFDPRQTYYFDYGITKLIRTEETVYDDQNETRYTNRVTETDYSPTFYLPTETRTSAEGNIVLGTRLSYPQNFTRTIPANADADLLGIRTLQARNAYLPIETINFRQDLPDLTKYYKTGKLTTYNSFTVNGLATALPRQLYLPETDFNNKVYQPGSTTSLYQPSADWYNSQTINTDKFPVDRIWQPRLTMTGYDPTGNLTGFSLTAGASTTMSYGTYAPSGGIPFSVVLGETKNAGQPSAQTSVFSYQIPLLGVADMFAPNNLKTSYEYDAFGRLARIKDNNGNVLKQFTYHYGTAP